MSKRRFTEDSWKKEPWFKALVQAMLTLKTEDEIMNFLRDIGTLAELQSWSERFEVAKQISQGRTYREIAEATGASTTTVTRVGKFLENGEGGYRKVLNAPRHHRMVTAFANAVTTLSSREEKPVSVLQKYLEKHKNQQ